MKFVLLEGKKIDKLEKCNDTIFSQNIRKSK